ncbi:Sodium/calcium exchanger protein [Opisthorchis viverrini]|uniref:Sodium/calcium exchanger protein n=1 Tax=Opisthorchis viverrini TaxID=6198 RepID=A0A1S8WPX8_OPIVI|nr:Sodium/calcium exchanger protein [Opisthorchis viverrini]
MLGCVAALKTAVTGITLVAIGTSLPDAFASRTAARLDDSADNSIGNITGSNSVNVFLGLGVPWVISAIDATLRGKQFCVSTSGVCEASMLFLGMALLCLGNLICRRKVRVLSFCPQPLLFFQVFAGELGGPVCSKWISGLGCITLWIIYVLVLSLRAYDIIGWNIIVPQSSCGTTGK